jgi:hypothetical protein
VKAAAAMEDALGVLRHIHRSDGIE